MGWFDERFQNLHGREHCPCVVCGRDMWFPKSKAGKYLTCSQSCAQSSRAERKSAIADLRRRGCSQCGCEFVPKKSQLDSGQGLYCSHACAYAAIAASTINAPEAQKRAAAAWRQRHSESPIVNSGARNPNWNGGRAATIRRVIERRRRDPFVRLVANMRARVAHSYRGYGERSRTRQLLGCAFEEFRAHIEKQFLPGMGWDKLGREIHIDHIVPLASATTKDELTALWHFTNLRPVWARENLSKGGRREFLI